MLSKTHNPEIQFAMNNFIWSQGVFGFLELWNSFDCILVACDGLNKEGTEFGGQQKEQRLEANI